LHLVSCISIKPKSQILVLAYLCHNNKLEASNTIIISISPEWAKATAASSLGKSPNVTEEKTQEKD